TKSIGGDLMRRPLLTLVLAGVFGAVLTVGEAQACCHLRKSRCTPACAPAPCPQPVCQPCPPPPPPPCPPPPPPCPPPSKPKHCGLSHHNAGCGHMRLSLCHRKPACPPPCPAPCPVAYAPVYATGQIHPSGQ